MKHNHLLKLIPLYNLVHVGGNIRYREVLTNMPKNFYHDERDDFLDLVHKHGYDILYPGDFDFDIKVMEYNRVLELQAKKDGFNRYNKYDFSKLCICGDEWIFVDDYNDYTYQDAFITDSRGGMRRDAGRKPKYAFIDGTASIRVPSIEKDECRNLIDFLVDMQSKDTSANDALSRVISDAKSHIDDMERSGIDMGEHRKYLEIVVQLLKKLPFHFCIKKDNVTESK